MESRKDLKVSVFHLRTLVGSWIEPTIHEHRLARLNRQPDYDPPTGEVTDEEVDDFVMSHPGLDQDTVSHFVDLQLIADDGVTTEEGLEKFKESILEWSQSEIWRASNLPWMRQHPKFGLTESKVWLPSVEGQPGWLIGRPTSFTLAVDLIGSGKLLSDLDWRSFENLLGELLEKEGYRVVVSRGTKDGGIDVVAECLDQVLGPVRTIWQAKKYDPSRKVNLSHVRELSAVRANDGATKAIVVTTGFLTKGAIDWIQRDKYQLGYRDGPDMEAWVKRAALGSEKRYRDEGIG